MTLCCLCGDRLTAWDNSRGLGNNPWPLAEEGRCCDDCNAKWVAPARQIGWDKLARKRCSCGADAMHWSEQEPHFFCCYCHVTRGGEPSSWHEGCREAALRLR